MKTKIRNAISLMLLCLACAGSIKAQNVKNVRFNELKETYISISFEKNLNNSTLTIYADWGQNYLTKVQDTTVFKSFVQVLNLFDQYGYDYISVNPYRNIEVSMKKGFRIAGDDTEYLLKRKK